MIYLYLFLALLLVITGAVTDYKHGYARNIHMAAFLVGWIILSAVDHVTRASVFSVDARYFLNLVLSVALSIGLYLSDIWAPGDCKMFIVLSAIFPMKAYTVSVQNVFPSLYLFLFAFAAGYVYLLLAALSHRAYATGTVSRERMKSTLAITDVIGLVSNIGLFSVIHGLLNHLFPAFYGSNRILCFLTVFCAIYFIRSRFPRVNQVLGLTGVCAFVVFGIIFQSWSFVVITLLESLFMSYIVELIHNGLIANTYREITAEEVRPGIILSFSSVLAMQNCIDPDIPRLTTESRRSRLNEKQAVAVKRWAQKTRRTVMVVEMIPFIPFLAISVALQIMLYIILSH